MIGNTGQRENEPKVLFNQGGRLTDRWVKLHA
jgi:hypothetical protein